MLRTHRVGKGPGGCGGWSLGSRNRRGPGVPPTLCLRGQGTSPGSPAGFLTSSGWGKHPPLLSCSSGLGGPLLPASPDLPGLPPMPPRPTQPGGVFGGLGSGLGAQQSPWAQVGRAIALCSSPPPPRWLLHPSSPDLPSLSPIPPRTHVAWMGLWRWGTGLGAQQAPLPAWARRLPSDPLSVFLESPSILPLLISLASVPLIVSDLHFSSHLSPPTSYLFTLGFLPSPWSSESPTSGRQVPSLWGDTNSMSFHTAILTPPPGFLFNSFISSFISFVRLVVLLLFCFIWFCFCFFCVHACFLVSVFVCLILLFTVCLGFC